MLPIASCTVDSHQVDLISCSLAMARFLTVQYRKNRRNFALNACVHCIQNTWTSLALEYMLWSCENYSCWSVIKLNNEHYSLGKERNSTSLTLEKKERWLFNLLWERAKDIDSNLRYLFFARLSLHSFCKQIFIFVNSCQIDSKGTFTSNQINSLEERHQTNYAKKSVAFIVNSPPLLLYVDFNPFVPEPLNSLA